MNDTEALHFVREVLAEYSARERQFVRAVTRHETYYSQGWEDNGTDYGDPELSNNWGAIQYVGDGPSWFGYRDTHADGESYAARFRTYPNAQAGLEDAARTILKPNVRAALKSGNGRAAIGAMKKNRYFEAPLASYQKAINRNYDDMLRNTGEKRLLSFTGSSKGWLPWLGLGAFGIGVAYTLSDRFKAGRALL